MRKLIWCCSAAGLLATGSFLSLAYYACQCPDSLVGRSMQVIAEASVAMQPLSGLTSMAVRTNQANAPANETVTPIDERIPDDPQPVASVRKDESILDVMHDVDEAAPIVIGEDDPMPGEQAVPVVAAPIEMAGMEGQEVPPKGSPIVMPHCEDDEDEPALPPKMPRADAVGSSKGTEHNVFKAWMELFEEGADTKSPTVEELPAPKEEEPQTEPKCQEDIHRHEHYSGCPRTTCPYSGKNHTEPPPAATYLPYNFNNRSNAGLGSKPKKKGSEEASEEPPHPKKTPHSGKEATDKEECPRTKGVDTMEYRKSDGGLDEYGPGPWH